MTISNIEVSLFLSESALSKYAIKHATIVFEKRSILTWRVTFGQTVDQRPAVQGCKIYDRRKRTVLRSTHLYLLFLSRLYEE